MIIHVNTYDLGSRPAALKPFPMALKGTPDTLRSLLLLCVEACVERQHRRIARPQEAVLSQEAIDNLARVGRITFGIDWNGTPADPARAAETALQAYEDGLFRVFRNDREIVGLDTPLTIAENDTFTFVRLTMLSGGGW